MKWRGFWEVLGVWLLFLGVLLVMFFVFVVTFFGGW